MRKIGTAFIPLEAYLAAQSTAVLVLGLHPRHSPLGIRWTAVTALVMSGLAAEKASTGAALGNPVLRAEGRIMMIDGILATAVLVGLVLNAPLEWWWADPLAGYVFLCSPFERHGRHLPTDLQRSHWSQNAASRLGRAQPRTNSAGSRASVAGPVLDGLAHGPVNVP